MASKLIVLVVFTAVAQGSLAAGSDGSSDLKTAKETSRTEWRQAADTVCKVVRDKSTSIGAAEEEYRKHQSVGGKAFFEAADLANYPELRTLGMAEYAAERNALFKSLKEARGCKNHTETKAAIENYKNSLPYDRFLTAFHAVSKDKGSPTPAVNALKKVYQILFNEIETLATSVCGGEKASDTCAMKELHAAVDALTDTVYSWM